MKIAQAAKFLTALAGALAQALTLGLVAGAARGWATVVVGVLTAAAVYLVPNQPATGPATTGGGVTGVAPADLIPPA